MASADQKTRFLGQRDTHIAEVVKREVLDKGRRALIIAGGLHVFHRPPGFTPMGHGNAVFLLEHEFGQRVFVIAGSAGASDDVARRLAAYRYPAILGTSNTWLGSADAGKLLLANPYGAAQVRTVADAVLYLGPSDQLTLSYWNPAVFLDPTYWAELQRRAALGVVPVGLAHLRQERPARFSAAATEE